MNDFQMLVKKHESQNQKKESIDSLKPIADYVHIELLYGDYPNEKNKIYAVRFKSKRGDGRSEITLLMEELINKQKDSHLELRKLCGMNRSDYHHVLDYIDMLMQNDQYTSVPNIYAVMKPSAPLEEAVALHQKVSENILHQINRYPLQSSNRFRLGDPGLIPDDHINGGKYDSDVIAVAREHLLQLLDLMNGDRLNGILRTWINLGYLIKTSKQPDRLQEQISVKYLACNPRLYIIWIRDLENKRKMGE